MFETTGYNGEKLWETKTTFLSPMIPSSNKTFSSSMAILSSFISQGDIARVVERWGASPPVCICCTRFTAEPIRWEELSKKAGRIEAAVFISLKQPKMFTHGFTN